MSCENCLTSPKGQSLQFDSIKTEAKKYAVENKITVAIYKEANQFFYIEAGEAIRNSIPVMEFISQHNRVTT